MERIVQGVIVSVPRYPNLRVRGELSAQAPAETLLSAARDAGLLLVGVGARCTGLGRAASTASRSAR
ncbi:hypothetical protein [Streptomyces sp. HUAS TT20]|uniref:hypothetical protein n=1 Tax=Streptomyces sp. HUAS TT20 TaxID=3447509 RepID=UPI0029556856|nr:hypothetical protein [Streptomyces sp. HUAS 15-9]